MDTFDRNVLNFWRLRCSDMTCFTSSSRIAHRTGGKEPLPLLTVATKLTRKRTTASSSLTCTSTQLNRLTQTMGKKTTTTDRARHAEKNRETEHRHRAESWKGRRFATQWPFPRALLHSLLSRRLPVQLSSRQSDAQLRTKCQPHDSEVWGPLCGLDVRFGRRVGHETGRKPVLRCEWPLGLRQPLRATIQLSLADRASRCSSLTASVHVKASGLTRGNTKCCGMGCAPQKGRITKSTDDRHQ